MSNFSLGLMSKLNRRDFCSRFTALAALLAPGANLVTGCALNATGDKPAGYPKIIGTRKTYRTAQGDTLVGLARRFELGYLDIVMANPGVDPWVPGEETEIILPTVHIVPEGPRDGLLINLAELRLYFFRNDGVTVDMAPIGIGAEGWATPTGRTKIVRKKENPTWHVPKSIRRERPDLPVAVPPGPDNPLGSHALYFDWPSYLLHGTNKPDGIGRHVSHGCVRLYPEDVARLYGAVEIGTPVTIIDRDLKVARVGDEMWIEVHPNHRQAIQVEKVGTFAAEMPRDFVSHISTMAGETVDRVDWSTAKRAARERRGVPVQILRSNGFFNFLSRT